MGESGLPEAYSSYLEAGNQALSAGEWQDALVSFQSALELAESPEALEGLGMAAWWLDDVPVLFDSRTRAYTLFRQHGDAAGMARMATWLALDYFIFRGSVAVARGWLERGKRQLAELDYPSFEHGFMTFSSGYIALEQHDLATARAASLEGVEIARQLGIVDFEMLSLALYGLVQVSEGNVDEGMRRLDEAVTAALAGEVTDPDAIVTCCCYLFYACERVRDYDRATQWCDKIKELCERWSYRSMFSVCRTHYAGVLMWRGDWKEADAELREATDELMAGRLGWAMEGLIRLAELRRRQGRLDEAAKLFERASIHPHTLLGKAELALHEGDAQAACDFVERFLRRVPADEVTERFTGLELLVRATIAAGDVSSAQEALSELEASAGMIGTDPLRGAAYFSRGLVAHARGDLADARRFFEDAVDLYLRMGAPYETARARIELAFVLSESGRSTMAIVEAREAISTLERIGAKADMQRASRLLADISAGHLAASDEHDQLPGMTPRESEILLLVARGLTNQQIADRLFLSVRTVERHISTIYQKIGAEGRTARAVAVAYVVEHTSPHPS